MDKNKPSDFEQARAAYYNGDDWFAFHAFEQLADHNPVAKRFLAYLYLLGVKNGPQDPVKAAELLHAAAAQGDLLAMYTLAGLYGSGQGVEKNEAETVRLYTQAANAGLANAQLNLGSMYQFGHGVPKNSGEAVKWIRAAAEQGHVRAQSIMGLCYSEGIGLDRDLEKALHWYKLAADKDYPEAQCRLAWMYGQGVAVPKDSQEMHKWLQRAADWGEPDAQYNLGVSYALGEDLPRDEVQAHLWFSLAANQSELGIRAQAKGALKLLEPMMSAAQLSAAKNRLAEWRPKARIWPEQMPDWQRLSLLPGEINIRQPRLQAEAKSKINIPAELTKPTAAYKWRAWFAMFSLMLFIISYFALAFWFSWTAVRLYSDENITFEDGVIGAGFIFLAVFMLKALLFMQRANLTDTFEITQLHEPELFSFLYELADAAGAPRPKKVVLSARVNAMVFYDISIFNLLFPSRKNLEIGLALVNVLTISEFKAVLAHEFGHFSQKTMAIGIWVHIAQQIAAHIVAKRDALDKIVRFISNVHLSVAWIGWLLSLIIWSIRSLLDSLLRFVVLAQRSLSRQMEFQADLVAVSITGSDELVHALHKLQAADEAWERARSFAHAELRQGGIIPDIFEIQQRVIDKIAVITDDPEYGIPPKLPAEQPELHRVFRHDAVAAPLMWASHPANIDREENAKRYYVPSEHDARSAWLLFARSWQLREQTTVMLLGRPKKAAVLCREAALQALDKSYAQLQLDPVFRGAYLNRSLTRSAFAATELYDTEFDKSDAEAGVNILYPAELKEDLTCFRRLEKELNHLKIFKNSFYQGVNGKVMFRGKEIARRDLAKAINQVDAELTYVRARILAHDRLCRSTHLKLAQQLGNGWSDYLIGLIEVLHYAEHTQFNLLDAYEQLKNVYAVVTADGKITSKELNRLLASANDLYELIKLVYKQSNQVILDETLCNRLQISSWAAVFNDLELLAANKENIEKWLTEIDGWINTALYPLSMLAHDALEQLLSCEQQICRYSHEPQAPVAPSASRVPAQYLVLPLGKERNRLKLSCWDRFYNGDGAFLGVARMALASAIVAMVVFFGNRVGLEYTVTIYNGLSRAVTVKLPQFDVPIPAASSITLDTALGKNHVIETITQQQALIERFTPELHGHGQHYVYNVAAATPLLK
ncbi:MAG: M48 family metalloprotease, partial [Methylococcales bacterium]